VGVGGARNHLLQKRVEQQQPGPRLRTQHGMLNLWLGKHNLVCTRACYWVAGSGTSKCVVGTHLFTCARTANKLLLGGRVGPAHIQHMSGSRLGAGGLGLEARVRGFRV
jgi:hypothetical protein